MAWTGEVALFFGCIVVMLAGMTIWELRSPNVMRKGLLPIATTRGDRLFIGLNLAAWTNLAWIGLVDEASGWWGFAASMVILLVVMRKG